VELELKPAHGAADRVVTKHQVHELLESAESAPVHVHDVVLGQQQVARRCDDRLLLLAHSPAGTWSGSRGLRGDSSR